MKLFQNLLLVLLFTTAAVSCKKDKEGIPAQATIEGRWDGSIGSGTSTDGGFFGLVLKADHQLVRINSDGQVKATGTWQLTGNSFTGNYTYYGDSIPFNLTGTLNSAQNNLSGTWQMEDLSGAWTVTKNQ